MGITNKIPWDSLESWTPSAFFVGGIVLLGYAALKSALLLTGGVVPDVVQTTIGHFGLLIPTLALLGLYPRLRDAAPRLSLAGVASSAVSGALNVILLVVLLQITLTMEGYPAIPEDTPLWGTLVLFLGLLTIMLGFFLMGIATLRTDVVSRSVSYLLLVPAVMWAALFVMHATGVDGTVIGVVVYTPIGVSLLTIGYHLRRTPAPIDRGQPSTDPTV